jgi:hypothetical protein
MYQEIKGSLQYIYHMTEIVVRNKVVVCSATGNKEAD